MLIFEDRFVGLVDDQPHRWPVPLQALEHRSFRTLWLAIFVSNAGSWMQRVATAWIIYTMSESAMWLGIDAALTGLPTLLLLPLAGVLADRVDRRVVLLITNLVNALLAVALAVLWWSNSLTIWELLSVSFLSGVVAAFAAPASQSLIPTAAGEDHIPTAVALNSFQYNVARAIGPAVGGLALTGLGAGWCFLLNALSFLGVLGAVFLQPKVPPVNAVKPSIPDSLRQGLTFIRDRKDVRHLLMLVSLLAFGGAPMVTLLPAVAKTLLHEQAGTYAGLLAVFGVGAALSGILLTFYRPGQHFKITIVALIIVVGICHILIAWTTDKFLALIITFAAGLTFVGAMIELGTGLLSSTPDTLRGRVSGVQQLCFRVAQPVGCMVAALLTEYATIQTAFVAFGIVLVLGASLVMFTHSRELHA